MQDETLKPKGYNPEFELKAEIIYESLCENYSAKLIDDVFGVLKIDKIELADDKITKRVLDILNGEV